MNRNLTEKQQSIVDARIADPKSMTYKALQLRFNCSQQTVYQALWLAGLTGKGGARKRISSDQRDRVVELRLEGKTYMEISFEVGISQPSVNKILRAAGLVNVD